MLIGACAMTAAASGRGAGWALLVEYNGRLKPHPCTHSLLCAGGHCDGGLWQRGGVSQHYFALTLHQ
jgi:hypothetical protein